MKIIQSVKVIFIGTLVSLGVSQTAFSQKAIELTNVSTGKKKIILSSHRVEFIRKEKPTERLVGRINTISETGFTIGEVTIPFEEVKAIGRRRKGSGFLSFMAGAMGAGFIIGALSNDDPCPDCIDAGSTGEGYTVLEVGLGLTVLTLGVVNSLNNTALDTEKKWKLAIIDQSVKK